LLNTLQLIAGSANAAIVYLAILEHFDGPQDTSYRFTSRLSVRYLSERTKISKTTTQDSIQRLAQRGLISRQGTKIQLNPGRVREILSQHDHYKRDLSAIQKYIGFL